ncbi:MAG: NFACT family protein, partial [Eubacteriales bacterium]
MPLDALTLTALVGELKETVIGARIDKIHQPSRDEIVLSLRSKNESGHSNCKLLLSGNPQHPRAHLTTLSRENPHVAPMFCMLLRKHLTGARILEITQPPMERVVEFHLETLDELGFRSPRRLILEGMGRHSNLILVDAENRIIDCLRRVDCDMSAKRQVMAGLFYHLPPTQGKENLLEHDAQSVQSLMVEGELSKWI